MEGKFVAWDKPPKLTDGTTGHAGEFPNCRCYPEPVIPELAEEQKKRDLEQREKQLSSFEKEHKITTTTVASNRLNNAEQAVIHNDKIMKYALDPTSEGGKGKAKGFFELGFKQTQTDVDALKEQILSKVGNYQAIYQKTNNYGVYVKVEIPITGPNGKTRNVRTAWIYDWDGVKTTGKPRLTTFFPIEDKKKQNGKI
jgi:uncharacterized protein with gpF-like domain